LNENQIRNLKPICVDNSESRQCMAKHCI